MRAGVFWIALVVALLVGNAVAVGVLLAKSGDPTGRVMPDYYKKAVAWDETVAALRASDALGWGVTTRLVSAGPGRARVIVTIARDDGTAVDGALVDVDVRHRSVAQSVHGVLSPVGGGRYEGELAIAGVGLHVIEVHAASQEAHYGGSSTVELELP
jgi:nitrogen fixation protein FixH